MEIFQSRDFLGFWSVVSKENEDLAHRRRILLPLSRRQKAPSKTENTVFYYDAVTINNDPHGLDSAQRCRLRSWNSGAGAIGGIDRPRAHRESAHM